MNFYRTWHQSGSFSFFPLLTPVTSFPAFLTVFPALCSIYLFLRPITLFLHLAVVTQFPGALAFFFFTFPSRVWCCLPVFQTSFFFTCFSRCSVEYIWDDIVFGGRSLRMLCYEEVYESQNNSSVNPIFLNLVCPTLQIPSDFQITWNPRMRSTAGFCYYSK